MQFPLPFILVLVIPSGAGPNDPRVVIGDPAGSIGIFTTGGDLVGLITSDGSPNGEPGFFVFEAGDLGNHVALETVAGFPGITFADSNAAVRGRWSPGRTGTPGTTQRFVYSVDTPRQVGSDAALFTMLSGSDDDTLPPRFDFDSSSGTALADMRLNSRSLPRGVVANGFFRSTSSDSARAAGADTDMTVTVALIAGRTYSVRAHVGQLNLSVASAVYVPELEHDGTVIGRFDRFQQDVTANGTVFLDGEVVFTAAADDSSAVLTMINGAASGGSITAIANATNPRTLIVEDLGVA